MVEEPSPLLPRDEESIEAETDTGLEPEPESGEVTPEPDREPGFVCDCEAWVRSACKELPFYKEHESQSYCVLHYPGKEKSADFKAAFDSKLNQKDFDFRGVCFPDEVNFNYIAFSAAADFSSATFSARAYFGFATFSAAADFSSAKFSADAYFRSAKFSADAGFSSAKFSADANFSDATFSAVANFNYATFSGSANFSSATFSAAAHFISATFSAHAYFNSATFSAAVYFSSATFSADAYFYSATFSSDADFDGPVFHAQARFSRATFNDSIHFFGRTNERILKDGTCLAARALGKDPSLGFQHVRLEHPERIAFHSLQLRPHWFVNVDSRRFVFTDVAWEWERLSIKQEIAALKDKRVSSPNRLLAITCRQLAENAETNNRYEEASKFRYWAMDLARRTKWKGWTFWKTDWLHMLYWAASGYGERILRAFTGLLVVCVLFALLYTQVGFSEPSLRPSGEKTEPTMFEDNIGRPLDWRLAIFYSLYSLQVMTLQKPEPKPLTTQAQTLVTLEMILGPAQGALLLLAIRRKFMR